MVANSTNAQTRRLIAEVRTLLHNDVLDIECETASRMWDRESTEQLLSLKSKLTYNFCTFIATFVTKMTTRANKLKVSECGRYRDQELLETSCTTDD